MFQKSEIEVGGRLLSFETGKYAKQADGSVFATYGESVVLATAVADKKVKEGADFFPLVVDYIEKTYAAGKIPGGFYKREGRPREKEVLTSRLIDRPIRPLFPENFYCDTQVIAFVLSADIENDTDIIAINAASAALTVSDIPFNGPIGAVRIGRIDGNFIVNPTIAETEASEMNLVCVGTPEGIVMVEAAIGGLDESIVVEALEFAKIPIAEIIECQRRLQEAAGKPKREFDASAYQIPAELRAEVEEAIRNEFSSRIRIKGKLEREAAVKELRDELLKRYEGEEVDRTGQVRVAFEDFEKNYVRKMILEEGIRADGRTLEEIRPITCEVCVLPRAHGSAVFTRGETQALAVLTLGTSVDEQKIDALEGESFSRFLLHYNFPPFSVGEASFLRGPGRREIGHGALAAKALTPILPNETDFPYTLRLVSEILESNGSSSMATVCGGSLALMDAGVPIKDVVSGIAMGLIMEGDKYSVLSDILGLEDHLGDMDFKVTGTRDGVTALQLDVKVGSVSTEILNTALAQAKRGRLHILDRMLEVMAGPRAELSPHAPRITSIMINKDKIRDVIGPGGKMIRSIVELTGVKIDVDDSGEVKIASTDEAAAASALKMIQEITAEAEEGKVYKGKVKRVEAYGAFVEILPGVEGLLHISQMAEERVGEVRDIMGEGDEITVIVLPSDEKGRLRLSRKAAFGRTPGDVVPKDELPKEAPRRSSDTKRPSDGRRGGGRDGGGRDGGDDRKRFDRNRGGGGFRKRDRD
ncbi:MAG: polyribonucleotide nucleotidyltransferase [Candidatus Coatesbacteria bacterium]|nr:polyribonucleotide nucleotidyltransferase [Candidatus Coatesbacteria bacterium]